MAEQHPLNGICPYYAMFPVDFPLRILRHARTNQLVVDPFCGRGTSLFAARQHSLLGYGIDTSLVAVAISRAKLATTNAHEVMATYDNLLRTVVDADIPQGKFWRKAYHPKTLATLCALRQALIDTNAADEAPAVSMLRGIALGALHGPLNKGSTPSSFFSNQMLRTFAPKPDYAVKFWLARKMNPPFSDVRSVIARRAERLLKVLPSPIPTSHVCHGDARDDASYKFLPGLVDWVVTSPPYLGMRTYEQDQWLRLWFVGGSDRPRYGNPNHLTDNGIDNFARGLALVWDRIAKHASPNIRMVVRFGAIGSRNIDYSTVLRRSLGLSGACWRLSTSRSAGSSRHGRRQSLAMGKRGHSDSIDERDFYIRLAN